MLNALAENLPTLMGGSADLAPSNNTIIKSSFDFQKDSYAGRNIRFGVREFAMGAVMSGMFLHGGVRPYGGTFLVFADYMRPSIRLACLMNLGCIYVFTHDSIGLGEDGPTHQPVEHLAACRAIPGLYVMRPGDVWLLCIVTACVSGCVNGMLGFLPLYLRNLGWQPAHWPRLVCLGAKTGTRLLL